MKEIKVDAVFCFRSPLKRGFLLMIILAGWANFSVAQVGTINAVPQILSPDAAALGKFVEVPVSNYSGLPQVEIPVYQFKAKDVTIPISLAYHASGVKVKEFPGMVGANWALNAGGTITRIVRGEPDGNTPNVPGFYKQNAALLGTPGYDYPDQRTMTGVQSEYYGAYKEDSEFDIYYYNFMGHSGRFTFDNSGQPYMMDVNDMKISFFSGAIYITDAQGVVYYFGDIEYMQWPGNYPYSSAWYLSSISFPRKNDADILFSYKKYDNWKLYRYAWGPESYTDKKLFQDIFPPTGSVTNPTCQDAYGIMYMADLGQGETCILDKITYKGDTVKFYHDTSRADNYKVRLDSIRVSQGGTLVHTTRFGFTFSNSGSSDPKDKKMLLASVQSNDQPAYTCSYYGAFNSKSMPGPYVNGTDLWGFYNGGAYTGYTPISTPRHPDYRYGQIGSLQSLTYPTGGNTEFTYEGNDFSYCQNELDSVGTIFHAGGLRIKKIKFNSPVSSDSFEKTYEYTHGAKSSGVLEAPFANLSTGFYWGEGRSGLSSPYCYNLEWPQVCSFYIYHHENAVPLGNAQGGAIGYAQVIEKNKDGSKKVMQFTNGGFDPYTYYPLLDPLLDGYADGYSNDFLGDKVIQDRLTYDNSSYRGKLKGVIYYNSSGQKLKQEVHKFSDLVNDRIPFYSQQKTNNFYIVPGYFPGGGNECSDPPIYGLSWSGYFHVQHNIVPTIDSAYTFIGADTLKAVTKYAYNDPLHTFASKIVQVSSLGDSTITTDRYAWDFNYLTSGLSQALGLNYINLPVESVVVKKDAGGGNARTVNAQVITFKPNEPFPDGLYKLSNQAGLTDYSSYSINGSGIGTMDSRCLPELKFHRFDNQQNVTEQKKWKEPTEVLVWGYQHRFVVARVSESDYATVIALVDSTVLDHPSSDAAMRTELAKIRTGLAGSRAKVTTYTYASLKGVTSMTDPMGVTTYYEYDDYGRLKRRKDMDGDVKDNIWYHYKP